MSSAFFYHLLFCITILSCIVMLQPAQAGRIVRAPGNFSTVLLMVAVVLVIGSLPVLWGTGADRDIYASQYISLQDGTVGLDESDKDVLFTKYMLVCGGVFDYKAWFYVTAFIYCLNHYIFARSVSKDYAFVILLMFFSSFMFYSYGVNTIRAGFAASFLLLALSFYERPILFFGFMAVAIGCHASMMLPAVAIVTSRFYDGRKLYLTVWVLSIFLSAMLGHFFETLFSSIVPDSRVSYLNADYDATHYTIGFRIDFIIYSCVPVFLGYYYIAKKGFNDRFYSLLYNTYLLANSFWILVIRANFSDRFAYLSWFLYPILLIYPLLKQRIVRNQKHIIVALVLVVELFTYIMFLR